MVLVQDDVKFLASFSCRTPAAPRDPRGESEPLSINATMATSKLFSIFNNFSNPSLENLRLSTTHRYLLGRLLGCAVQTDVALRYAKAVRTCICLRGKRACSLCSDIKRNINCHRSCVPLLTEEANPPNTFCELGGLATRPEGASSNSRCR